MNNIRCLSQLDHCLLTELVTLHVCCRICSVSMGKNINRSKQTALLRQVCTFLYVRQPFDLFSTTFCVGCAFVSLLLGVDRLNIIFFLWICSHGTEMTQWDHPEMAAILHSLCELILFVFFLLSSLHVSQSASNN